MSKQKLSIQTVTGYPQPLGPHHNGDTVNFALFARHANSVTLVLDLRSSNKYGDQSREIRLDPDLNRTGDIWHIGIKGIDIPIRYGYRVDGDSKPETGVVFFPEAILLDPYCRRFAARPWGDKPHFGTKPVCCADPGEPFDWMGDRPLRIPPAQTIIYEVHVRGFTRHSSSNVKSPGTFLGLIEKIPYLKDLGITAVELLPVTEWDETDNKFINPVTGVTQLNYWGYNPLSFFALKSGLAQHPLEHVNEFKTMVRSLHQAGIEVILDMVFNHTGETDLSGTTSWLRGLDNAIYYLIDSKDGNYHNFSGCGNTVHCNHPVIRALLLESLRYWVQEMHIDGFRFDLAAIFSRVSDGEVLNNAPLVELIAEDPLLRETKIIAEPWDASGLYQVGSFSNDPRWMEWNGRFRDDIRRFMAGHPDTVRTLATRIAGSSDLYQPSGRGPLNSINFITSHDGFTLHDLVSYEHKYNQANGEDNRDGEVHNLSWNSGHEGADCPQEIALFRHRRMRTFAALLLLSQGIPMLSAGDEFGKSQNGNNNCWCQDNELSWLDWSLKEANKDLLRFFRKCIALRKRHGQFRRTDFFQSGTATDPSSAKEITWQSLLPGGQDWSASCRTLGFLLHSAGDNSAGAAHFFVAVNGDRSEEARFILPDVPAGHDHNIWLGIVDTSKSSPADIVDSEQALAFTPGDPIDVPAMGLVVMQSGRKELTPPE